MTFTSTQLGLLDGHGYTPLDWACVGGFTEILDHFHKNGHDLSALSGKHSFLHKACYHGQSDVISYLLNLGFDVNALDDNGWTPAVNAFQSGQCDIAWEIAMLGEWSHDCTFSY